ncbi:aldehyde dehydrogenase family protein [Ruegeria sediminis]|uniref:Aldehyde dehydrogenase family protein n=1 Tax=Ruegeria sediminis TaxID=2583820 RepID=A0ABY2WTZ1_9RHOB|nr:aldehyde dehydrogenase family protein [Ruegeria sediminis]TMV04230.1 aldehyde dehydrogenase family protein [Ruegeria sediminis]
MDATELTRPETRLTSYRNLIGGRSVDAQDGRKLDVLCPSDGIAFGSIPRSGAAEIDLAVRAARTAFETVWCRFTATERGRLLMKLGDAILAHKDELGALESMDTGKPASQGLGDIVATARYFEFYGSAADKLHGETIPFLNGYTVAVVRDPHGVTGHIVPWNYPSQIFGRSVGASLACGNTCVVKPAEDAGLTLLRIAELALEVGIPEGVLNVVFGLGAEAGAALTAHPDVDFVSFTGSPEVGTLVQKAAAENRIGCTLELGGKSPQLVFADADLDAALPVLVKAIVQNGGQTCSAGSRVLVERPIFDKVAEALAERFAATTAGPHEQDRDLGAMVTARQQARVKAFLAEARAAGVPVLAEGKIAEDAPSGGFYVKPTLFCPVPREARIACEEIFGPVLAVMPFEDEADGVALANATDYGLVAGIWTENSNRSMRVARAMRCGQVFINGFGAAGGIELPFGGVKKSGHGREKGFEALYEFSASKTIVHHHK